MRDSKRHSLRVKEAFVILLLSTSPSTFGPAQGERSLALRTRQLHPICRVVGRAPSVWPFKEPNGASQLLTCPHCQTRKNS